MNLIRRAIRKIGRMSKKAFRMRQARREGLVYEPPNFVFHADLSSDSVVIDAGCSFEADFSLYLIERYGLKSYAVDPTLKHREALKRLEEEHAEHFDYVPLAVSATDGTLTFHESRTKESGSFFDDHVYIENCDTHSYQVKSVGLASLLKHIDVERVDLLKLDLEGAEYELLSTIEKEETLPFDQIFVEFHHHAITHFDKADTQRIVDRMASFGFSSFSLDDDNYLFRRANRAGEQLRRAA